MGQTTIILMILTIISKIFGFVRESVMAAFIGAGELKSIYSTATSIPTILSGVVASGIVSAYIPVYNKIKKEKCENEAYLFTSNLISIIILIGIIAYFFVFLFAEPILKLLSPKLYGSSMELAVNFTRIVMISILPLLYSSVIRGFFNIKGNFFDLAFSGIFLNIIIIISTIITGKLSSKYVLIIGALIANFIQFIRFPIVSRKFGFEYKFILNIRDEYLKQFLLIAIPIFLSATVSQISLIVDNSMASAYFGLSSISRMYYSKTMLNFITGVVTLSVATVTYPEIAKAGREGDTTELKIKIGSAIVFTLMLVMPATLGMMALSNPIIKFAFERRAFTSSDTIIVAGLLEAYAPYIIFTSIIKIISNGFYSFEDSKTPLYVMIMQQILNIILNIILSKLYGINGLAYATSVSTGIAAITLICIFYNRVGKLEESATLLSSFKIILSALFISIFANRLYLVLITKTSMLYSLFISVILSGITYFVLLKLLKVPELIKIRNSFLNKLKQNWY